MSNKAITFLELLIVITIIGILFSVTVVRLKPVSDNLELDNFVKDLYYLSRYLQACSIRDTEIYYLKFDKGNWSFQALRKDKEELKNIEGRFGKIYQAPAQISIATTPFDISGVYFYPDASTDKMIIAFENKHGKKVSLNFKGAAGEIKIE